MTASVTSSVLNLAGQLLDSRQDEIFISLQGIKVLRLCNLRWVIFLILMHMSPQLSLFFYVSSVLLQILHTQDIVQMLAFSFKDAGELSLV